MEQHLDPKVVLVVGDAHGDTGFIERAAKVARHRGVEVILHLGDFGAYWPGSDRWLAEVDRVLARHGVKRLVFVDGNHEGWVSKVGPGGLVGARASAERDEQGFVVISERVRWADRGHRWTWGGVRFGALGGAFSVDHGYRVSGLTWWPGLEAPDQCDVERLGSEPLDVLVTHDAPDSANMPSGGLPLLDEMKSAEVRYLIEQALHNTNAALVLHGHWHLRYGTSVNWWGEDGVERIARVEGIGANISPTGDGWAVLRLTGGVPICEAGPPAPSSGW